MNQCSVLDPLWLKSTLILTLRLTLTDAGATATDTNQNYGNVQYAIIRSYKLSQIREMPNSNLSTAVFRCGVNATMGRRTAMEPPIQPPPPPHPPLTGDRRDEIDRKILIPERHINSLDS